MNEIFFANKNYFWLLIVLIPIIAWYFWKQKNGSPILKVSTLETFKNTKSTFKVWLRHILFVIRICVIVLLVIILARPQSSKSWESSYSEGIDIVLAMDISGSMLAQDFSPNRLEASKKVAIEFVAGRPHDRIGLVAFSGESFTKCPITSDHAVLINSLSELKQGMIEDGTAIGMGLSNAIARLKNSTAKSKVIILLTDGVNNMGNVAPLTAADIAATFGVRVYTVGVGKNGFAPFPVQTPFGIQYRDMEVQIDESTLTNISEKTNGKYFRATDNQKLKLIYQEIDKLEKQKLEIEKFTKKQEEFLPFALIAGILLLVELILRLTILRRIP